MSNNELQTVNPTRVLAPVVEPPPLTPQQIIAQVRLIQEVMSSVMRDGEHYGVIPGCGKKPSLLQPGAQKLQMTFRLCPKYTEVIETDMPGPGDHKAFSITCSMYSVSGNFLGEGVGYASTKESKWRYRTGQKTVTDRLIPQQNTYFNLRKTDPKKAQDMIGGPGYGIAKKDGSWYITEGGDDNRIENENIADVYNTAKKIAAKRAQVAAVLNVTAASDIFTQDIEDLPSAEQQSPPQENVKAQAPRSYKEDKSLAADPPVQGSPRPQAAKAKAGHSPVEAPDELPFDASRQPIDADGDFFWNGPIKDVTRHPGKKANGEEYVLYRVHMENGKQATTFDEALANDAEYIKGTEGIRVIVEPNTRKAGTFTYLGFKDEPPAETP